MKNNILIVIGFVLLISVFVTVFYKQLQKQKELQSEISSSIFQKEKFYALQNIYVKSLEVITMLQDSKIPENLTLKVNARAKNKLTLDQVVTTKKIVIFIPKNSCKDCINEVCNILGSSPKLLAQKNIILTDIFDEEEKMRFYSTYNVLEKNWDVYHLESTEYFNKLNRKIVIAQISNDLTIKSCFVYDTNLSIELLKKYLLKL
ncbi:hypothetical protein BZG01_10885 [Labilibaculum manganireducens]|uniref:Uncharacterized protein n=1 Tax=Labilibaculum manganireducens TaxID=1940525 RepID=A0A2N3I876_9BACT|nr:hypothetical protein [Labilibaculum manganireducens]PKQ66522.1 hypothetical protein BZG01_10885 [Labilibaculum manganireducens]